MKTSRPVSSRASLASLTPVELIRSRSSSRKWCASFRRFAPNVFVSISSAPALMKLDVERDHGFRRAEIRLLRTAEAWHCGGEQRAHPPVARRSRARSRGAPENGCGSGFGRALRVSFRLARHIHPGSRPAGFGTLPRRQVAEASQGRFPQPLSMRSGTLPASGTEYRQGASRDPCPDNARGAAAWPLLGLLWKEIFRGCPRRIGAHLGYAFSLSRGGGT